MKIFFLCCLLGLPVLAGCASPGTQWAVSRAHKLGSVQGKTFVVVPMRQELARSPEFKTYAQAVVQKLALHGMRELPADQQSGSDYVVILDYGAASAVTRSGELAGSTVPATTVVGLDPSSGSAMTVQRESTYATTVEMLDDYGYRRYVEIVIHEGQLNAEGKFPRRYQATAQSIGPTREPTAFAAEGVAVLLDEFPGKVGKAQPVWVPAPAK